MIPGSCLKLKLALIVIHQFIKILPFSFSGQMFQSAEEDPALRETFSRRAKQYNLEAKSLPVPPESEVTEAQSHQPEHIGVGLCGVGDASFPVAVEVVKRLQLLRKGLVATCAGKWASMFSKICEPMGKIPQQRVVHGRCSAKFCWTHAQGCMNSCSTHLAKGLLLNILRALRLRNRERGSALISGAKFHPLLVVHTSSGLRGWLLVCTSFKPLRLHGWRLKIPQHIRESVPFCCKLTFEEVSSDRLVPALDTFEQVIKGIADGDAVQSFKYSMPKYHLFWDSELLNLHVHPQWQWISMSAADLQDDSDDEGDVSDPDESDKDEDLPINRLEKKQDVEKTRYLVELW